jgi:hypothetical protein
MTRISICLFTVVSIAASAVWAQDPAPTTPPQPAPAPTADPVPSTDPAPPGGAAPAPEPLPPVEQPGATPQWTYERQMQNQQGTVTNTHRHLDAPEEGRYVREHVVTNPRGEMTQIWERVNTEDGYEYRSSQVWLNPDGTPLRQHERTMSGTDPYNYTRERSHTLPDGRTVNHSQVRTWDGTDGTMERSFTGPNGQTRESVRSWTPDEPLAGEMVSTPEPSGSAAVAPAASPSTSVPAASQPAEQLSWWQKLNPFRKRGNPTAEAASASARRRGFTIGAPNSSAARPPSNRSGDHPAGSGSQNTHRPSWAGGAPRSMSPQGPPAHANSNATASRPNPARGPNPGRGPNR